MARKQPENPCDRCGFNVTTCGRDGDPLPKHTYESECFRAVYEAALEAAKEEIGHGINQHVNNYHASEA